MPNEQDSTFQKVIQRYLYTSHFLSAWNDRVFEFGSVLFLATRYSGTLLPVSLFAIARYTPFSLFSYRIGRCINDSDRLPLVLNSIIGQRLAVIVFSLLLLFINNGSYSSLAVFSFLGCVENINSTINTIAIERDWVVIIAAGDATFRGVINSRMRSIDLFCKLVGPAAIGFSSVKNDTFGIIAMLGMSLCSVALEYRAISWTYAMAPDLALRAQANSIPSSNVTTSPSTRIGDIRCYYLLCR